MRDLCTTLFSHAVAATKVAKLDV